MRRRAILLAGGVPGEPLDPLRNPIRYRNDVAAFFRVLTGLHGYAKADVRCLWGPGADVDLDADGVPERLLPATRQAVEDALAWGAELSTGDRLFLMVTNHGSGEGVPLRRPADFLTPEDLDRALGSSRATKILVFGQCSAGTFARVGCAPRAVCCACDAGEESAARPGNAPAFDEFLYHLAGALGGIYPDGRPLREPLPPPPEVTVAAAFDYARRHDHWGPGGLGQETPRLDDPAGIAASTSP